MGYSPWGHKRVGQDLLTKQQQQSVSIPWHRGPNKRKSPNNIISKWRKTLGLTGLVLTRVLPSCRVRARTVKPGRFESVLLCCCRIFHSLDFSPSMASPGGENRWWDSPGQFVFTLSLECQHLSTQHNAPKIYVWKYPGVPVVNTALLVQGAQVQSLAKELRFHILHSTAKKKKNCVFFFNSVWRTETKDS